MGWGWWGGMFLWPLLWLLAIGFLGILIFLLLSGYRHKHEDVDKGMH